MTDNENRTKVTVAFPLNTKGLLGRHCSACKRYFQVKPPELIWEKDCTCPYCGHKANHQLFFTVEQDNLMRRTGENLRIKPFHEQMKKHFKVVGPEPSFEIEHYTERDLNKTIECDSCHQEFAVDIEFSFCPGCSRSSLDGILQYHVVNANDNR